MPQPHADRLSATHRQPDDPAVLRIGLDTVSRLDQRHHALEQILLEQFPSPLTLPLAIPAGRVTIGHHDQHRHGSAVRQQIIGNHVCAAQQRPMGIVVSRSMQQVEDGIPRGSLLVVTGWRVDVHSATGARGRRGIPVDAHRAVRNVSPLVVSGVPGGAGDLHIPSRALAIAEHVGAEGIGDAQPVHVERSVVNAGRDRPHGQAPDALFVFLHRLGADRFTHHGDLLGLRGLQAEGNSSVRVDFRGHGFGDRRSRR